MKGDVWEGWIYGMIAFMIIIVVYFATTPFINVFHTTMGNTGNYSTPTTNTSFHNLIQHGQNLWNLWPIAGASIIFILLFYFAEDDSKTGVYGYGS